QGPDWLAQLLYAAPLWLNAALKLVLLVTVVGVGVRLYQRDWEIDAETQLLMGRMAGTIAAVAFAVVAFRTLLEQPYLVDVACGAALGWSAVTVALSHRVREWFRPHLAGARSRLAGGWMLLAALSVALLSMPRTNLFGGELVLVAVAGVMVLYNLVESQWHT
ncbi:MAG: hypothetical protein ABEI98_12425, partial [Halorhabdus sp.]